MSEEAAAPLDCYATAKPDEPVFTLQGGDPLAAPMVRAWGALARIRAGVMGATGLAAGDILAECAITAGDHVVTSEREQTNLLVRATAAEEVSWDMDAYRQGNSVIEQEEVEEEEPDDRARIDLHDYRVRSVQRLSDMVATLVEISDELDQRGHFEGVPAMKRIALQIRNVARLVEPRRQMKGKNCG